MRSRWTSEHKPHTYIQTRTYPQTRTYRHVHTDTYIQTRAYRHVHTHRHVHTDTYIPTDTYIQTRAYTQTYKMYKKTHSCQHAYMTHTSIQKKKKIVTYQKIFRKRMNENIFAVKITMHKIACLTHTQVSHHSLND